MRKQKLLALLLALAMVLSLLPVMAAAEGEEPAPAQDGVQLDKKVVLEEDGTYTIHLEAYATGTVTTTVSTMPDDVVLVLDQSGSMAYTFSGGSTNVNQNRRQYALKQAVKAFIEQVADKYTEEANHRISIVTFGSNASTLQGWTSVDAAGEAALLSAVNGLPASPSGATRVDLGMAQAETLLGSGYNAPEGAERKKIVIVFTDGVPTTSSEFSESVANDAIESALNLKNDDAAVYTVGIFNGADPAQLYGASGFDHNSDGTVGSYWEDVATFFEGSVADVEVPAGNRFLNYLSNNFADADEIGLDLTVNYGFLYTTNRATITKNFTRTASGYYMVADDASSLSEIFVELSHTVGSTTVELGTEAVLRDIVADDFILPEGASSVTVSTSDYLGEGNWAEPVLCWPDVEGSTISATIVGNKVDVAGFSYKDNFIGEASGNEPARGKKLIVTIRGMEALPGAATGGNVNTNNPGSGLYEDADAESPVISFISPSVLIANTTFVMDYAKPLYIPSSVLGLADRTHLADSMAKIEEAHRADPIDLVNGYFEVDASGEEEIFIYTPQTMNWVGYDQVFAFGTTGIPDTYEWSSISILPASNIYYEDDFITNEDSGVVGIEYGGNWSVVGESDDNDETPDHDGDDSDDSAYGWVDSMSDDDTYSDGTAHWASLDEQGTATATFTFTGTGVDVYSRTNMEAGMIMAYISKMDDDGVAESTKWVMVDNLSMSGDYYGIPTLSFSDLEHGTYEVGISVRKAKAVDENGEVIPDTTRSTYYLDGIRIYNPLAGVDDGVVSEETGDKLAASFMSVREMLSEADDNTVFIDRDAEGNAFAGDYNATEYGTYGPKNEVYLAAGQSVTFRVAETGAEQFYVGLKSPEGAALAVQVTNGNAKSEVSFGHVTDLYYQVNPSSNGYVSIYNAGEGILSVTKIQVVGADAAEALVAVSAGEAVAYAAAFDAAAVVDYGADPVDPVLQIPSRPQPPKLEIVNPIIDVPIIKIGLLDMVENLFRSVISWF